MKTATFTITTLESFGEEYTIVARNEARKLNSSLHRKPAYRQERYRIRRDYRNRDRYVIQFEYTFDGEWRVLRAAKYSLYKTLSVAIRAAKNI